MQFNNVNRKLAQPDVPEGFVRSVSSTLFVPGKTMPAEQPKHHRDGSAERA